jgi:hypothetical protein
LLLRPSSGISEVRTAYSNVASEIMSVRIFSGVCIAQSSVFCVQCIVRSQPRRPTFHRGTTQMETKLLLLIGKSVLKGQYITSITIYDINIQV